MCQEACWAMGGPALNQVGKTLTSRNLHSSQGRQTTNKCVSGTGQNEAGLGGEGAGKREAPSFCRVIGESLAPKGLEQRPEESEGVISAKSIPGTGNCKYKAPSGSRMSLMHWKPSRQMRSVCSGVIRSESRRRGQTDSGRPGQLELVNHVAPWALPLER